VIPATCPCCEVLHPPHRDGCTFDDDCPNESAIFDEMSALRAEIAKLREERRWVTGRVIISRETFDKVVAALSRCTVVANEDGEEWNDEEVIDARDSIRRDAEMPLPPGPETKEVGRE
jgi:hypothetical protein